MVCARKRKFEEDERQSIPNVLQGEVARLDPKFLVNLDPSHCSNNGTVHLICKLGEWQGGGAGQSEYMPVGSIQVPLPQAHLYTPLRHSGLAMLQQDLSELEVPKEGRLKDRRGASGSQGQLMCYR